MAEPRPRDEQNPPGWGHTSPSHTGLVLGRPPASHPPCPAFLSPWGPFCVITWFLEEPVSLLVEASMSGWDLCHEPWAGPGPPHLCSRGERGHTQASVSPWGPPGPPRARPGPHLGTSPFSSLFPGPGKLHALHRVQPSAGGRRLQGVSGGVRGCGGQGKMEGQRAPGEGGRTGRGEAPRLMVLCAPQLESEYLKIPGDQVVSVVFIK